jgi:hypothetical protein
MRFRLRWLRQGGLIFVFWFFLAGFVSPVVAAVGPQSHYAVAGLGVAVELDGGAKLCTTPRCVFENVVVIDPSPNIELKLPGGDKLQSDRWDGSQNKFMRLFWADYGGERFPVLIVGKIIVGGYGPRESHPVDVGARINCGASAGVFPCNNDFWLLRSYVGSKIWEVPIYVPEIFDVHIGADLPLCGIFGEFPLVFASDPELVGRTEQNIGKNSYRDGADGNDVVVRSIVPNENRDPENRLMHGGAGMILGLIFAVCFITYQYAKGRI